MRNVTCTSCGKRYDYDTDDFCPKCGSYNPPPGQRRPAAPHIQTSPSARPAQPARPAARTTPVRPAPAKTPPPPAPGFRTPNGGRKPDGGARRPAHRPEWDEDAPRDVRRKVAVFGVAFAVLMLAIIAISLSLMDDSVLDPKPDTSMLTEGGFEDHVVSEPFPFNGWTVTVEDPWEPTLPDSSAIPEGRCIAVDLWVEGGGRISGAVFATPYLLLPDGAKAEAVDGNALLSRQLKNAGVYDVVPADAQWEDPLFGQLVFFLPEDMTGTTTLVLPAAAEEDAVPTLHYIDIVLPEASVSAALEEP